MQAISIIGFSNSGKTTLISRLSECLEARGLKVAIAKHTHHELDKPDTDTALLMGPKRTIVGLSNTKDGKGEAMIHWGHPCFLRDLVPLLDADILGISEELRKIALIIILTRAGLGLDLEGLKKTGRPALLMCFIPASFEVLGVILLGTRLMGLTVLEAAVLGAVLAAVSPAVVVPRMVRLMEEGYGKREGIPQMILAGVSVDDVYVIVLFSTFTGMMQGKGVSAVSFINIPVSILLGTCLLYTSPSPRDCS